MKISKYRLTHQGREGSAVIVYENGFFKSILNDFKPVLNDTALNYILSLIPAQECHIQQALASRLSNKSKLEKLGGDAVLPTNEVIALFCDFYQAKTKVKYKVSRADAGKINALKETGSNWGKLFQAYFDSSNFLFKNKWSIANLAKYWNELRVEAFGEKPKKNYPIPYNQEFFNELNYTEQREYWAALREAGYYYHKTKTGGGEWIKRDGLV